MFELHEEQYSFLTILMLSTHHLIHNSMCFVYNYRLVYYLPHKSSVRSPGTHTRTDTRTHHEARARACGHNHTIYKHKAYKETTGAE